MTDYFVVCHGSSSTQVEAIARSVEKETLLNLGEKPFHVEGKQNSQWILMDYFNVVVHIFNETTRNYYSLEELWADADFTRYEEVA
jgi:ribosome-associated protein